MILCASFSPQPHGSAPKVIVPRHTRKREARIFRDTGIHLAPPPLSFPYIINHRRRGVEAGTSKPAHPIRKKRGVVGAEIRGIPLRMEAMAGCRLKRPSRNSRTRLRFQPRGERIRGTGAGPPARRPTFSDPGHGASGGEVENSQVEEGDGVGVADDEIQSPFRFLGSLGGGPEQEVDVRGDSGGLQAFQDPEEPSTVNPCPGTPARRGPPIPGRSSA
jgi:hypothetical protein